MYHMGRNAKFENGIKNMNQIKQILKFMDEDTLFLKEKLKEKLCIEKRKSIIREIKDLENCYNNFINKYYK